MIFKRRGKRKIRRRRRGRKVGRRTAYKRSFNNSVAVSGRLSFPFPPSLRAKMRTQIQTFVNAGSFATNGNAYELQIAGNCIQPVGPQINYPLGTLGGGGANVPAGLTYLLSNDNLTGASQGIYSRYIVHGSRVSAKICLHGMGPSGVTPPASSLGVVLVPIPTVWTANVIQNTVLAEQPLAKFFTITQFQQASEFSISSRITTREILGKNATFSDSTLVGTVAATPNQQFTWILRVFNMDNTSASFQYTARIEVIHDCTFQQRNFLSSGIPSLDLSSGDITTRAQLLTDEQPVDKTYHPVGMSGPSGIDEAEGDTYDPDYTAPLF